MPDRDCTACGHPWLVHGSVGCLFVDNGVCGCPKRGRWARDVPEPATSGPVRPAERLEPPPAPPRSPEPAPEPQRVRLVGGIHHSAIVDWPAGKTAANVAGMPRGKRTRYELQPDGTAHAAEDRP